MRVVANNVSHSVYYLKQSVFGSDLLLFTSDLKISSARQAFEHSEVSNKITALFGLRTFWEQKTAEVEKFIRKLLPAALSGCFNLLMSFLS